MKATYMSDLKKLRECVRELPLPSAIQRRTTSLLRVEHESSSSRSSSPEESSPVTSIQLFNSMLDNIK